MKKTNAVRILDGYKIKYKLTEYIVDETDLSAQNVSNKIGVPLPQVFKTLVVRGDKTGVMLACIPGGDELDLKSLAAVSGNKKTEMVPLKDVQGLTGYIRGGVSPLGVKKAYPVFIDESSSNWSFIAISAGIRGCQILLEPQDLIGVINGNVCKIARQGEI